MSVSNTEKNISKVILYLKFDILRWNTKTNGVVIVPEGRKHKDGYIYSGCLDNATGQRVDQNKVVSTLEEYLDLLSLHKRKYKYFQIMIKDKLYLLPSHTFTLTNFVRNFYPEKYESLGKPEKLRFNTSKWDFDLFNKTDHLYKDNKRFDIPSNITRILIGVKGNINKEFYTKTNCSYTIKFDSKTQQSYLILYADKELLAQASDIILSMINSANKTGKVCEIPDLNFPPLPTLKK